MTDQRPGIRSTSYTVARSFSVWMYGVGHSALLLRSSAQSEDDEIVDMRFDAVDTMYLHKSFKPLTIRAADAQERRRILAASTGDIFDPVHRPPLYLILESAKTSGFVVCAHARVEASRSDAASTSPANTPMRETTRTLWYAGPAGGRRHEYTQYEAWQPPRRE